MVMDKNLQLYHQTAKRYRCVTESYNDLHTLIIIFGRHRYLFRSALAPFNNSANIDAAKNKYVMNKLLEANGIPVPESITITREDYASGNYSLDNIIYPVVAKPTKDTSLGDGVLCNINDEATLRDYFDRQFQHYPIISVESFKSGFRNYRVTVFQGKVIGVIERQPANVTGDGQHTIRELILITNQLRNQLSNTTTLKAIVTDQEMQFRLNELQLTLDSVPKAGENITLCYTCNSSRGGSIHSLGTTICKANAELAVRTASILGLEFTGLDIICEDIQKPITKNKGYIIECNHNPDITIHEHPQSGQSVRVSRILIKHLIRRHVWRYLYDYLHFQRIGRNPLVRIGLIVVIAAIIKYFV